MNEYQVTWKLFRSWASENLMKGARLKMTIIWCLLAIFWVALGIFEGSRISIYSLFFAFFCIYRAFFRIYVVSKSQYRILSRNYGGPNWIRRITFEDDGIILTEANHTIKYNYTDVINIREEGNKIWLEAANKTVLRLYKDAFVESSWEECKARINAKE